MAFAADQTARLQTDIDTVAPKVLFQDTADVVCNRIADLFLKQFPDDADLIAAANGLRMVGQRMHTGDIQPDAPSASHNYLEGLFVRDEGDGYTEFLRAYADCWRITDNDIQKAGSIWNLDTWKKAIGETANDIADASKDLGSGFTDSIKWLTVAIIGLAVIVLLVKAGKK